MKPQTQQHPPHNVTETTRLTPKIIASWKKPPFQRPLTPNAKVTAISKQIKEDGGVVPGVITIGILDGETYKVDGQHRLKSFEMTGLEEGYADVRFVYFQTMADMAQEYVNLNSKIVALRPDDVLRGLEESMPLLRSLRAECPYVGYDNIRRGPHTAILSMSMVLRAWFAAQHETPQVSAAAVMLAQMLTEESCEKLTAFLKAAYSSWGRDPEYKQLWGSLNLTITMWLYHRVTAAELPNFKRHTLIKPDEFSECLKAMSASSDYCSWLVARLLTERDRAPCLARIKAIFNRRLQVIRGVKQKIPLPNPAWAPS